MKIASIIILGIYMIFFASNIFDSRNTVEKISSFILLCMTCIPFFYIAIG